MSTQILAPKTKIVAVLILCYGLAVGLLGRLIYSQDQIPLMQERDFHSSGAAFLWEAPSYSRTRHFAQGDVYLFRPLYTLLLATEDLFFRTKPKVVLIVNGAILGLFLFVLLQTLSRSFPWRWAFLGSVWAVVFPPFAMVASDAHFGLYLFFPLLFLLAWGSLERFGATFLGRFCFSLFLFLSACFHESVAIWALGVGVVLFRQKKWEIREGVWVAAPALRWAFLGPPLIFCILNLWSWGSYPAGFLGPGDRAISWKILGDFAVDTFYLLGKYPLEIIYYPLHQLPITITYLVFLPVGLWFFYFLVQLLRPALRKELTHRQLQGYLLASALLAYLLPIALARGALRNIDYIRTSYWHSALAFVFVVPFVLHFFQKRYRKLPTTWMLVLLLSGAFHATLFWRATQKGLSPEFIPRVLAIVVPPKGCVEIGFSLPTSIPIELFDQGRCREGQAPTHRLTLSGSGELLLKRTHSNFNTPLGCRLEDSSVACFPRGAP